MGRGERITVKTVEADSPRRMVREMQSAAMLMSSTWECDLDDVEGGCRLTMHGETFIRPGGWMVPIFRVMMVIGGGVKKGLVIQMDMVAKTLGVTARHES